MSGAVAPVGASGVQAPSPRLRYRRALGGAVAVGPVGARCRGDVPEVGVGGVAALAEALQIHVHELMAEGEARSGRDPGRRWFGDEEPMVAASQDIDAMRAPEPHTRMRRQVPRSPSSVVRELSALIEDMHPDDVERLLDLARRLSER